MFQADTKPRNRRLLGWAGNSPSGEKPTGESSVGQTEVSSAGIIDLPHLTRMTLGEKRLKAEVLALFDRQAGMLLARMQQASPQAAAAFAHTLAGSARGVGAWNVAAATERVELAATDCDPAGFASALRHLAGAIDEARAAIRELLGLQ
jgi:HPt (histidine-containing phosphotransfer) domain-containing protein